MSAAQCRAPAATLPPARGGPRRAPRRWLRCRMMMPRRPFGQASAALRRAQAPDCQSGSASVPSGMALNQDSAPVLFDRALLRRAARRARRSGPRTFLLDRVAEDMGDRLQAVMRDFSMRPTSGRRATAARRGAGDRVASRSGIVDRRPIADDEACRSRRNRSISPSPRWPAVRQRFAGRAGADPPRAEAGRAVAGGDDRRRYADRTQAILRRGGGRMRGRRVAARRAVCRPARHRRAAAARRLRAAGHRCRSARGALRQRVCADAGSAAHGRHQHPVRAAADADPPRHDAADGGDLCRALRRSGRPHPRHLRCGLAVRLGAAREPARSR